MSTIAARRLATGSRTQSRLTRRLFEWGGIAAAAILIAFGIGAIVMGFQGRNTVSNSLAAEKIVGSEDMTPSAIRAAMQEAGLTGVAVPSSSVAGEKIDTGAEARTFAEYMRIHTLESSGGLTYAEMGRFATADGNPAGTNDAAAAVKGANGQPVSNGARDLWVTETALTTALNTSYMAQQLALFGIVVGVALLLSGVGFGVLAVGGALRHRELENAA
ncbi:MAG TPA: hypothetical protein VFI37_04265 [Gaiellaceae bacterium]|jgi:hypothetical protein|nr:hypothetical protein [Gaiellaceae bacterium]